MEYSDCDPDRPTTPESRLRDALEADVARHLSEVRAGFEAAIKKFGPTEADQIAQANREALQAAYQNNFNALSGVLPGQWFAVNNAQLRSMMHNPNRNPYCFGFSHLDTIRF